MTTLVDRRREFRAMLEKRRAVLVPGAANALTARVIEDQGFEACYVTGAGIANTLLGVPDIGLVTMSEIQSTVAAIAEISSLPLVVDMDTGFGNAINTHRTVRVLERAGACAAQIEDQVFPKKCGHFDGKGVIPAKEMAAKVRAAAEAREDENFLIIARTDARAVEGMDAAMERANLYIEAGADVTFVEAPTSVEEMKRICTELPVPQVANLVVGGRTPMLPQEELAALGFAIVLYANTPLQAAMRAMSEVLGALKRDGNLDAVQDRLADFVERQRLVHKSTYDAMEKHYAVDE
ncbi:MAG: oxaloacetate decarboxylase [Thalassobaculaceae bacterium]|nr:oxaloacetate decarboxylase [Thalassobaculaceae bacterium]